MHFQIIDGCAEVILFPLVAPFAVATRTAYEAHNVILRLSGVGIGGARLEGLGAAAPVAYVTGETQESVLSSLRASIPQLTSGDALEQMRLRALLSLASELIPDQPSARAALEMALYDLWGQARGIALWHHFGAAKAFLTADLTIPIVSASEAGEKAKQAWQYGFRQLKIKVGDPSGLEADYDRLAAVAEAVPHAVLRVDANQAFAAEGAVGFIQRALSIAPQLQLIEQPVAKEDIDGLAYVHSEMRRLGVPALLFADESAQTVASVVALLRRDAVDGVNVKLMKSGLAGSLEIAGLCRAHGVKLMVGCMLESQLPLTAACALVAGSGLFDYIDLDSHHLLSPSALFTGGMAHQGAQLVPEQKLPGWGVSINPSVWNNAMPKSV